MNIRKSIVCFLSQYGKSATLTQYEDNNTDEYEDPTWTSSSFEINAIQASATGQLQRQRDAGEEISVNRMLVTDFSGDITGTEDASGRERPDEITWDGNDYIIIESQDRGDHQELQLRLKR